MKRHFQTVAVVAVPVVVVPVAEVVAADSVVGVGFVAEHKPVVAVAT